MSVKRVGILKLSNDVAELPMQPGNVLVLVAVPPMVTLADDIRGVRSGEI